MDIQFSGAVDFQPLINQVKSSPSKPDAPQQDHQAEMLESQNQILGSLNFHEQLLLVEATQGGSIIDIIA